MIINKNFYANLKKQLMTLAGIDHNSLQQSFEDDESPLRAELFSVVQMEAHGKVLAKSHKVCTKKSKDLLLGRLQDNKTLLNDACIHLTGTLKEGRQISPAAEWLLDNFYLIEEQIHTAIRHLPKGYSKELPRLDNNTNNTSTLALHPRVYDIALHIISHGDGRIDPESLSRFVAAYQQITPLTLGELWAIPIMLRLALIENLRRVAVRLVANSLNADLADTWADLMMESVEKDPSNLILLVADMARSNPPMVGSFVAELARRLQGQGPALTLPLTWIAPRLSEIGLTVEQLIQIEAQQKAADQVSISNSIGSLRLLGKMDWRHFVESMSVVEQTLLRDPNNTYALMDFATRDHYRHVIERISRCSQNQFNEVQVAEQAILLTDKAAALHGKESSVAHVGYFLIGDGLAQLEEAIPLTLSQFEKINRRCNRSALLTYLGSIIVLTLIILTGIGITLHGDGVSRSQLILLTLLSVLGISHLAIGLVNWAATILVRPNPLPSLDFSKGISPECKTLVAIPTMLDALDNIDNLSEALEVRFLANRDPHIYYCLLTDFLDSATETTIDDEALLQKAKKNIQQLNEKYADSDGTQFFLLHRARTWNAQEQKWMGHERKRGKLAHLNRFLRQPENNPFACVVGSTNKLSQIKYVITLDTDTQLPRDSARQLIAAIAHPLNQARFDPVKKCVVAGYGILQPRVSTSLPPANASTYQRLFSGDSGIDPYTQASSDVYQDIFGEGSFIGKGIYEVDAFEQSLSCGIPDNQILSHDLLEGCYTRSALQSNAYVIEDYPQRYSSDVQRRHRWIRGDWQLIKWLLPNLSKSGQENTVEKNPLSILSRWKLLDNLRRSLVSASLVLLLICAWLISPSPWFWSMLVISILFIPSLTASLLNLMRKSRDILIMQHVNASLRSAWQHLFHGALTLVLLPYDAFFSIDAISRALWRQLISHRRLLEWVPSRQTNVTSAHSLAQSFQSMWFSPTLAVVSGFAILLINPAAFAAAFPFLLAWTTAPAIAWYISEPVIPVEAQLKDDQTAFLNRIARKIWSYYETLMSPDDNWLPPDNIQEKPVAAIAHRTSPTNIGLALLANLTAYDFAYISLGQLLKRTENTLETMRKMERYRGHFYNWYDTQTLKPLLPMYISSVDSGNLAGHLLTLSPGLHMLIDEPIVHRRMVNGINTTCQIVKELAGTNLHHKFTPFQSMIDKTSDETLTTLTTLSACDEWLQKILICADELVIAITKKEDQPNQQNEQLHWWSNALLQQCQAMSDELAFLAPWSSQLNLLKNSPFYDQLNRIPTLRDLAQQHESEVTDVNLTHLVESGRQRAAARIKEIDNLALQVTEFAQMDSHFLFDETTRLMTIGYNVDEQRSDTSYYDLLASESRLCTFVLIAQGQIPQESWFALGRQLTLAGGDPVLLSWSGSMFEYLMPLLVMPTFKNTLLDQTYHSVVQRQIDYGTQRDVPWGISESGYHIFDASLNYQYRAFGVPGLGLKRGLGDDLVVAPYASLLALMVKPEEACENLQWFSEAGFEGKFGLYEAIDYTTSRLSRNQPYALIQSFMAHHQGMGLLSLAYHLLDQPMQKRFESNPLFQATLLLLQEKIPKMPALHSSSAAELADIRTNSNEMSLPLRIIQRPDTYIPEVQMLSNGRYNLMMTNAGGNCSRWKDLTLTRWREDTTSDNWGSFCYIQDCETNLFWSTTYQPTLVKPDSYEVIFSEGRIEYRRRDNGIEMHTEIVVSPEDDIEIRRTHIINRSRQKRTIEVTSYSEIVLAPHAAEAAHPAFSKLFVQTEILPSQNAILCTRRPRSQDEKTPWMLNLMVTRSDELEHISFETSREKFLGRGNSTIAPQAMRTGGQLSGKQGSVLDPIAAIRVQITLEPQATMAIDMVMGAAETREEALHLIDKYQDRFLSDRVFDLAWTHGQVMLQQLNITEVDAQLYARLASSVIYMNDQLRSEASLLLKNRRGQSGLWSYSISGDLPIVLVQIRHLENIDLVRQMVQAHSYWRLKGLLVDLIIWNEDHASYRQLLQDHIMGLIASGIEAQSMDCPGGIFVRFAEQMPGEDRVLLQTVARVVLCDSKGTLAEQMNRRITPKLRMPLLSPSRPRTEVTPDATLATENRLLFNGLGGFSSNENENEYIITTQTHRTTPAPWVNVLANPHFGSVISESGQAYSWSENAHEFRLTPWNNDAVSDSSGEAFYLRDDESGHFWSPTPLPRCGNGAYTTRHGHGYSIFEHTEDGIHSTLSVFVALDAAVKYAVLTIRNDSGLKRKLSATGYVEWVLGDLRAKSAMHLVTETDPISGTLFAHNAYNTEFPDRIAFFDVDATTRTVTGDRNEFLGRNGTLSSPDAMCRQRLSDKVGAGLDPCAAIQVPFELAIGQEREIVFMLGIANRRNTNISDFVHRYRGSIAAHNALSAINTYWKKTLTTIRIETPDMALNLLTNSWLIYQTISCRLWARSGFYQSGGAFGFRDQLQDVMALVHAQPHLAREHILLAAAHQFIEGDVMHWWHPPTDRGVRTRCSDDYLWLPLATCRYLQSTGDFSLLNERAHYLEGRAVNADEDSYYDLPTISGKSGNIYDHCVRAINHGLRFGVHGLPLIGSCDWNDGMDKVGAEGKGESVWLGFFLYDVLMKFTDVAKHQGDIDFAEKCVKEARKLQENIEANAWDGNWYRRAYFDDGTPLGSAQNEECQIDSISQSWAVLSGAGDQSRTTTAMNEVSQRLVQPEAGLIQLLDPPFDKSNLNPGYIKGYVPGVRENGGQYTHAAIWTVMAFAKMGNHKKAWELMRLINPLNHAKTAQDAAIYKVEPYVLAADVYAVPPHVGRGGWTWYTGSAGWMYQLIIESLLGLHLDAGTLTCKPCIPEDWPSFKMTYRYRDTYYYITVLQNRSKNPIEPTQQKMRIDGIDQPDCLIHLKNDEVAHQIEITI